MVGLMSINFSSLRACFGVRAANPTAATEPSQRQGGFRQTVARLYRALFHSKSAPVVPPAVVPQGTPAANLASNYQLIKPEILDALLSGPAARLYPETRERMAVALSMTKAWGADTDPLTRFANAQTVESLPEPSELFAQLKQAEPGPQAFPRMLSLIQKKFYPMIDQILDKPDVAAQVSTWLCKALGDGESLPKVTVLTQLDAPMQQQFTKLLETLATGSALPTTHHAQALALVKKAQLIQTLIEDGRFGRRINTPLYNTLTPEQKNDKDIAIAVVSKDPTILKTLSQHTRADKDVVIAAVKVDGSELAHASVELKADRDVVHHAVSSDGKALQYASNELRADPEIVLQACKNYNKFFSFSSPFAYASESLKNDRSFVLKVMGHSGVCLVDAKPQFQDDFEVVKAAVSNQGEALRHASQTLKANESIVKIAVSAPLSVNTLDYASEALKDNKEVVLLAVKNSPNAFQSASGRLQQDKEVLITAASRMPFNEINSINPNAKNDDDVMKVAILRNTAGFRFASETLRNDKELVMATVRKQVRATKHIPARFHDDKEVMMAAVAVDGSNLSYASKRLKDDKELVLAAVKSTRPSIDPDMTEINNMLAAFGLPSAKPKMKADVVTHCNVLADASPRLRADKDVVLAAVSSYAHQMDSVVDRWGTLRNNKSIALAVFSTSATFQDDSMLRAGSSRFNLLSNKFRKDKEIVMDAVSKDGRYLQHVHKELQNDKTVVKAAYFQNPESFEHASDALKNDRAFLSEIYTESLKYKNTVG